MESNKHHTPESDPSIKVEGSDEPFNVVMTKQNDVIDPEEKASIDVATSTTKSDEVEEDNESDIVLATSLFVDNYKNLTPDKPTVYSSRLLVSAGGEGEKSFIVTKVTKKKSRNARQKKVNTLLHLLISDCTVNDTPLCSVTARNLQTSDILFMELKEVEDDDEEPKYQCFGYDPNITMKKCYKDEKGEFMKNCACDDCEFIDVCDEYLFGAYCVAAVKRYYNKNKFFVTLKDAYIVYVSHYTRTLELKSFNRDNERKGMRNTEVTKPPHCMQEGSLKHVLHWVKWKVENRPEKSYYQEMRPRKKCSKVMKVAKDSAKYAYT